MRSSFRWTMALFVAALAARVHAATEITVAIHSNIEEAVKAAQDDPFIDEAVSYFGEQKARQLWKVAASRMPTLVVTDRDGDAARAVYKALKRVLEKGEDIDKALAEAKKELKK